MVSFSIFEIKFLGVTLSVSGVQSESDLLPHPNVFDALYPVLPPAARTYFFLVAMEVGTSEEGGFLSVTVAGIGPLQGSSRISLVPGSLRC